MKVLFLLKDPFMFERLGIMVLSSLLKRTGHEVRLLITGGLSPERVIGEVRVYNPKIICYSVMTGEHGYYLNLNMILKRCHNFLSVFGGPHPTFMPQMIEEEGVDAICRGEGDIVFPELLKRLEKGAEYHNINNFWFKDNGGIIKNPIGPFVDGLDSLPFPDRKLMYDADSVQRVNGWRAFTTMRGCPFECSYCFNHSYNKMTKGVGPLLRYRSVNSIISEIKEVKENFYMDCVIMLDDTFLVKPAGWLEEFSERLPREIGLPVFCNVRADFMNEKLGQILQKMGVKFVAMGVECGDELVAARILRRRISNEKIRDACKIFRRHKIEVMTQNLVGLPVDNPLEVDLKSLDFNISLRPEYAWSSILYPYPDTDIGKFAIKNGFLEEGFNDSQISNKSRSCLNFRNSRLQRQIVNLHKLFGIIVAFPALRIFTSFLISLPLTPLYTWFYFAFYGYKVAWRNLNWRSRKHYLKFYFKYVLTFEKSRVLSHVS